MLRRCIIDSFKDVIERAEDGAICHIRCVEQQKQIQAREMQLKLEKEKEKEKEDSGKTQGREGEKEAKSQESTKANRQVTKYDNGDNDDDDLFAGIMEDD